MGVDFTTAVTLAHTDSLQSDFIVPMTQGTTVKLYIDADVMTGRLLGVLPVPFLHMHKVLRCHATKMTVTHKNPCYRGPLAKTTDSTSPETDDLFQQLLGPVCRQLWPINSKGIRCSAWSITMTHR